MTAQIKECEQSKEFVIAGSQKSCHKLLGFVKGAMIGRLKAF